MKLTHKAEPRLIKCVKCDKFCYFHRCKVFCSFVIRIDFTAGQSQLLANVISIKLNTKTLMDNIQNANLHHNIRVITKLCRSDKKRHRMGKNAHNAS